MSANPGINTLSLHDALPILKQVVDPGIANVTTAQSLDTRFSNRAIADAQGNLVLVNPAPGQLGTLGDRKSTRLNSSHVETSYAVYCLKKKKIAEDLHYEIT